jgi:hypothetical protein
LIGTDILPTAAPTYYIDSDWIGVVPDYIPSGMYFIGWIIDPNDKIDEFNEDNNVNFNWTNYLLVDGTPPLNPSNCCQLIGNTESDVWQDSVNDTFFSWSGALDLHTSVAGYYYYWNSDPNGTSSSFTTSTIYDPPAVSAGTYYLRVCTTDIVGNNASWTTLYIFRYNNSLNKFIDEPEPKNNGTDNWNNNPEENSNKNPEDKSNEPADENYDNLIVVISLILQIIGLSSLMTFLLIKYYFKRREFVDLTIYS